MKNNASLYIIPFVKMNKNKLESYMNNPYCDVFTANMEQKVFLIQLV